MSTDRSTRRSARRALRPDRPVSQRRHDPRQVELANRSRCPRCECRRSRARRRAGRCAVATVGRQPDHREIRRAAADVDDQHQLLAIDGALVVERRGDRLELELDGLETRRAGARFERGLRFAVARRVVVVEAHGTPENHGVERVADPCNGALAQRSQVQRQDVGVDDAARADRRGLVASARCRARSSATASAGPGVPSRYSSTAARP